MTGGISEDVLTGLARLFYSLIDGGKGYSYSFPLNGTGIDQQLLPNVKRITHDVTVLNNSSGTVLIGYEAANFHLGAGASYTFSWKNLPASHAVWNDNGVSSGTLDVIS